MFRLKKQKSATDKLHGAKQLLNNLFLTQKAQLKMAPAAKLPETQLMDELDHMEVTEGTSSFVHDTKDTKPAAKIHMDETKPRAKTGK